MTLNLSNITPFPPFEAAETGYSFPGSQSGNFEFSAKNWGIVDTNTSAETVFVLTDVTQVGSPSYTNVLSGTQYSDVGIHSMNYGSACNYFLDANNNFLACETIARHMMQHIWTYIWMENCFSRHASKRLFF